MNTKTAKHLIYTSTGSYRYFCSEDINQDVVGECSNLASSLLKNIQPPAYSWWQREIHGGLIAIGYSEKSLESGRPTEHFHCIIINIKDYCDFNLQPLQIVPLLMSHRQTLDNIISDESGRDIGTNDEVIRSSDENLELIVRKADLAIDDGDELEQNSTGNISCIGPGCLNWLISRGVLGMEKGKLDVRSANEVFNLVIPLPVHLRAGFSFCCGSMLPEGALPFNLKLHIVDETTELHIPEEPVEYTLSQLLADALSSKNELRVLQRDFEQYWKLCSYVSPKLSMTEMNTQVLELFPDEKNIQERIEASISSELQNNHFDRAIDIVEMWEQNSTNTVEMVNQTKQSIASKILTYASNLTSSNSDADFSKISELLVRIDGWEIVNDLEKTKLALHILHIVSRRDQNELRKTIECHSIYEILDFIEDMQRTGRLKELYVQKTLGGTEWEKYTINYPYINNVLKRAVTIESLGKYSKADITDELRKQTLEQFVGQFSQDQQFWQITSSRKIGELLRSMRSNPQEEIRLLIREDNASLLMKVPDLIMMGAEVVGAETFTHNAAAYVHTLVDVIDSKQKKRSSRFGSIFGSKKQHNPEPDLSIEITAEVIEKHLQSRLNKLKEHFGHLPQFETEWQKYLKWKKH